MRYTAHEVLIHQVYRRVIGRKTKLIPPSGVVVVVGVGLAVAVGLAVGVGVLGPGVAVAVAVAVAVGVCVGVLVGVFVGVGVAGGAYPMVIRCNCGATFCAPLSETR